MPEEKITYEQVHEGVEEIRRYAATMEEIFNSVTGTARHMTSQGVFEGTASNAFSDQFEEFRGTFPNWVEKVREFADAYEAAAQVLKETETQLAKKAEEI